MSLPNILFVCYEDTSPRLGCYGDAVARTPHFDRVAAAGARFDQCFATAPVCGPSRSAVFLGMHQTSVACHQMRVCGTQAETPELPTPYVAVPPPYAKCFTEYLRAEGYFCTRQGKADFQFMPTIQSSPMTAFDRVEPAMGTNVIEGCQGQTPAPLWRERPSNTPFFAYYNLDATHESGQWPRADRLDPLTDPASVTVPPYLPDTLETRKAIARQYDNLRKNDFELGELLRMLGEDGLLDETIIMLWSDHGEGLPRSKRSGHSTGYHVPLVVRYPARVRPGTVETRAVSNLDLAPTLFALAGLRVPSHFHGEPLFNQSKRAPDSLVFSARDRIDTVYAVMRSLRDSRYTYLRTWGENEPSSGWCPYLNTHPVMSEIHRGKMQGTLSPLAEATFFGFRETEALYDREADPWEICNLIDDPEQSERLARFRRELADWQRDFDPWCHVSEETMVRFFWPDGTPPPTGAPKAIPLGPAFSGKYSLRNGDRLPGPLLLQLHCGTQGASIAYCLEAIDPSSSERSRSAIWSIETPPTSLQAWVPRFPEPEPRWALFTLPLRVAPGCYRLRMRAIRYGYEDSPVSDFVFSVIALE